ncbi:hypothetical protein BON23_5335 [Saccharomyces cerevisiae]|nr:hypothetical protein BON23_5335 [Saccharomyces cerevisiae]
MLKKWISSNVCVIGKESSSLKKGKSRFKQVKSRLESSINLFSSLQNDELVESFGFNKPFGLIIACLGMSISLNQDSQKLWFICCTNLYASSSKHDNDFDTEDILSQTEQHDGPSMSTTDLTLKHINILEIPRYVYFIIKKTYPQELPSDFRVHDLLFT